MSQDKLDHVRDSDLNEVKEILKLPHAELEKYIAHLLSQRRSDISRINDLEKDVNRLQLDRLTGLLNTDGLAMKFTDSIAILERSVYEIKESGGLTGSDIVGFRGYSVLWVDLVGLKKFNDEQGVKEGDKRLIALADIMNASARRPLDLKARFGGDDFVIVLINTPEEGTSHVVSRMQELLADSDINVSIGIADFGPKTNLTDALYMASDAMEQAKKLGKQDENFRSLGVGVFTIDTGSNPLSL